MSTNENPFVKQRGDVSNDERHEQMMIEKTGKNKTERDAEFNRVFDKVKSFYQLKLYCIRLVGANGSTLLAADMLQKNAEYNYSLLKAAQQNGIISFPPDTQLKLCEQE